MLAGKGPAGRKAEGLGNSKRGLAGSSGGKEEGQKRSAKLITEQPAAGRNRSGIVASIALIQARNRRVVLLRRRCGMAACHRRERKPGENDQ